MQRSPYFWRVALLAVLVLAVAGAVRLRPRPAQQGAGAAAAPLAPLAVEISGCSAIRKGPICEVPASSALRLWLPTADATPIALSTDRGPLAESSPTVFPDGRSLHVTVPADATVLRVRADAGPRSATWNIRLAPSARPPAVVEKALSLWKEGHLEEASNALRAEMEGDASLGGGDGRAAAVAALARMEYARGHIEDANLRLRESIALREALGRESEAADDAFTLALLLLGRHRFGEVRELLGHASALSRDYPDGRARASYYEGQVAWNTGDLRTALRLTRAADEHATRLGALGLRRMARKASAEELHDLGRGAETETALRELLASDGADIAPCARANLLDDIGWFALNTARFSPPANRVAEARASIEQAVAVYRSACTDPNKIANALVNLALAELEGGRLGEARDALAEAKRTAHEPALPTVLFGLHLEGRIRLASTSPRAALDSFDRETELAAAVGTNDDQRVAAEDRADALVRLGRKEDALEALDAAEALVVASSLHIPFGEGRETFFGARDHASALRVQLLAELGRPGDAMRAARQSRARFLASVRRTDALERLDPQARARWEEAVGAYRGARDAIDVEAAHDWELSSDRLASARERRAARALGTRRLLDDALALLPASRESTLRPTRESELTLLYFPTTRGWLAFAEDPRGVTAWPLGAIDPGAPPDELSKKMLGPLGALLARASRLRVLLYGELRAVDVHGLPWGGAPLLEHAVVEYPLDLDEDPPDAAPLPPYQALVVADPSGDLPAARIEADEVSAALSGVSGWELRAMRGVSATSGRVSAALDTATLFHYAGHATFGGPDGLDSALPLAGGGRAHARRRARAGAGAAVRGALRVRYGARIGGGSGGRGRPRPLLPRRRCPLRDRLFAGRR